MCDKVHPPLKYFKLHTDSQDIIFGTKGAACFDVAAYLKYDNSEPQYVVGYDSNNNKVNRRVEPGIDEDPTNGILSIKPGDRLLIPSGIILDIPEGYSVRTHPRSGTGYKIGLSHPHDEGIVDYDYYNELFLLFINITNTVVKVSHGQRLVQAEMIEKLQYDIIPTNVPPSQKTDREGGFGSTGK